MFEEGEWDDEAGAAAAALGLAGGLPAPVGPATAARSHKQRKRLLATLHRLAALAPEPPPCGSPAQEDSGASDSEAEQRLSRRKRQRRQDGPEPPGRLGSSQMGPRDEALRLPWQPLEGDLATEEGPRNLLTRKQWRNRQKNKRRQNNKFKVEVGQGSGEPLAGEPLSAVGIPGPSSSPGSRAASLRLRMEERLEAARFRYINQQLYTCPSQEAAQLFQEDPEAFAVYHRGFAQQVAQWPENPVQRLVRVLRHKPTSLVVADFGCGDCLLARSVRNKVHCFDLVALDPRVTVCDMAQVPLDSASVDVAVFCLALMGTNLCEILQEASRVLKAGGILLVAEVASRFADLRAFLAALARLGFQLLSKDVSGSHFYTFEFRKAAAAAAARSLSRPEGAAEARLLPGLTLRPCLYKRR